MAFAVVGLTDFLLTWFPTAFGDIQWEFGTVSASFDVLPIVVLGFGLIVWSGRHRRAICIAMGLASLTLALVLVAAAGLYALSLPVALSGSADGGPVELAVRKSMVRTGVQSVVYPIVLGFIGAQALKQATGKSDS